MARKLSLALGLVVLCALTTSGSRKPTLAISFHLEGAKFEGAKMVQPIKLGTPPQTFYFRRVPELTQRHIKGYYPFPADDGLSFGSAFKLNQNGTDALTTLSTIAQNRKLLTVLNGEPIDYIVLNETITDGYIVVWGGLTKADLANFDKEFARIQAQPGAGQPLVPERATSGGSSQPAPPIRMEDEMEEPKKKRKRLLPFGRRDEDS